MIRQTRQMTPKKLAQVLNYLKASGCELGLLVNFGHYPQLQFERIAKSRPKPQSNSRCVGTSEGLASFGVFGG
jgi:hypothetical protein